MVAGVEPRRVTNRLLARVVSLGVAAVAVAGLVACGDDDDAAELADPSDEARRGKALAEDNGCSACHRSGAVGPRWDDLYGSTVELDDGTTVVADDAYVTRAITDPGAEIVAGFDVRMPDNDLSDDEVAAIVAYIRELGGVSPTTSGGDT